MQNARKLLSFQIGVRATTRYKTMRDQTDNMDSVRAYRFRLYPDEKRQEAIDESLILSQQLYNALLEKTIDAHGKNLESKISQRTINLFMREILEEDERYYGLYSHIRVDIRNRLLGAYQNFFRRCRMKAKGKKVKVGFPRFRSRDKYNSIMHIENNGSFSIEKGMLRVSKIGRMKIEQHRPIGGKIKAMAIKRVAGKYYAIFTAVQDIEIPTVRDAKPVGIDVGLKTFAMLSDGTAIPKPKFKKRMEKHLAMWQRRLAKRTRWEGRKMAKIQSKNREKAKLHLQREWDNINNRNNDFIQKETTRLVNSGYTSFAFEDLSITNMVKNHRLADAIQSSCWGKFRQVLSYKAESAGMIVDGVPSRNTTQECSSCGNIKKGEEALTLKDRIYHCNVCGLVMDRDLNASKAIKKRSILKRATAGLAGSNASGDAASTLQHAMQAVSVNQEHTLQRSGIHVAGEAPNL